MNIPKEVQLVLNNLNETGFDAYVVGGCVRDLLIGREPRDWDVTTSAQPAEIQKLFPKSFYANKFGTVVVLIGDKIPPTTSAGRPNPPLSRGASTPVGGKTIKEVEITTYRVDADYSDRRHPDEVRFTERIEEDLARRDFTINAMAMDDKRIIDPFDGQKDLKQRIIRAVGNPEERFSEDALRLMRAVRLAAELDFEIESETLLAVGNQAATISAVSQERIRDELMKIVMSKKPEKGFTL